MARKAIPNSVRTSVMKRDGFSCLICNLSIIIDSMPLIEIAHLWPDHKGGSTEEPNLISLCPNCHSLFDRKKAFWIDPNSCELHIRDGVEGFEPSYSKQAHMSKVTTRGNREARMKWATGDPDF